jgi:hypothetical protein
MASVLNVLENEDGSPWYSHATSRSVPVGSPRTIPSRALSRVGIPRWPFSRRNVLSDRSRPATHHRFRMSSSRHCVTRAVTRHVTLNGDSIGMVVARLRRSAPGTANLITVRVSFNPSLRLEAAPRSSGWCSGSQDASASSRAG